MSGDTKSYKVTVLGDTYLLVTDEEQETIDAVVAYVEQIASTIQSGSSTTLDNKKLAVLALLHVARELLSHKETHNAVSDKCVQLAAELEQLL